MFKSPFSSNGRIRRLEYGLSYIIYIILSFVVGFISGLIAILLDVDLDNGDYELVSNGLSFLLGLPLWIWFLIQGAKRCHDRNCSGWWQLVPFYSLWMFFADGTPGPNYYGENPKGKLAKDATVQSEDDKEYVDNSNINFNENKSNMKGFKKCDKGHFYKDDLQDCNYCPTSSNAGSTDKTEMIDSTDTVKLDNEKTQVFGGDINSDKSSEDSSQGFDPERTIISGVTVDNTNSNDQVVNRRKLRGWLVSFDQEEFGIDYKINEGKNTIGKDPSRDVTIQDNEVTGLHGIILCRKDKFLLTDEVSTNGTVLNGKELTPRDAYDLNDGDEIKIGTTTLLFKTAFKK